MPCRGLSQNGKPSKKNKGPGQEAVSKQGAPVVFGSIQNERTGGRKKQRNGSRLVADTNERKGGKDGMYATAVLYRVPGQVENFGVPMITL